MEKSPKISAIIITLNEEQNIERCLESLQNVVDEIVVLDSFSTDKTEEICKKYDVLFEKRAWEGYSKSKNHANALASHSWILSIDADEALSEVLKQSILAVKTRLDKNKVYEVNRKTNYCGKWIHHCGWYPDSKIRLFQKNEGCWQGEIHETLHFNKPFASQKLQGDLLHYSIYNIEQHKALIEKYTTLSAQEYFQKNKKSNALKLFFSPLAKFFSSYLLKLGFLDGYYGWKICSLSAWASYLKYAKLKNIQEGKKLQNEQ